MKKILIATLLGLSVTPAMAANADHPYSNIDPRVDMGNRTGDSQVERLNRSQLDRNFYHDNNRNNQQTLQNYGPGPQLISPSPEQMERHREREEWKRHQEWRRHREWEHRYEEQDR